MSEALERDRHRHLLAPSTEEDLQRLERAIEYPLPAQYRHFLGRLGGGIYYDRHEVFGAARLMIHDIELVPDVLAVRERLAASCGVDGSPFLLPLHRTDGTCHWLDIRDGSVRGPGGTHHPSVADFLDAVVLRGNTVLDAAVHRGGGASAPRDGLRDAEPDGVKVVHERQR